MSDIVTRLLLKTNDFDANLEKSKKGVNNFQGGISNMAKTAGAGIVKFAGTIGVAMGAYEGLMKVINSSQTTGDAYVKMMDQAKASVDSFFSSIALGNFDGFLSNLQNVIDKAGDLSVALDNLGTKTLFNKAEVDDLNTKYQLELNKAKARNISDEERNKHLAKAKEYLIQMATLQQSLATANTDTSYTALQAEIAKMGFNKNVSREMWDYLIKDSKRSDIEKTSTAHKDRLFEYNKRIESSKVRDPYTEQVIDSDETKKIRAELKRYKESRFGLYGELNRLFIEAADDEESAIAQALKMRATANSLKVAVSNKELEVANADAKINGSYNKRNGGGSGSDTKIEPEKDSIAWYDAEISKLNKKLIATTDEQAKTTIKTTINEFEAKKIKLQVETSGNSIEAINIQLADLNKKLISVTDMQARSTIQTTINEFEQKKINLKFVVDQEAFKIKNGGMKDGALSVPIAPTYDKVPTHGKGGKNFKLPKFESPIKKKDIDINEEYTKSLYAVGSIMSSLSGITNESTAAYLQWGAGVVSSIAQAIPAIRDLITAKQTEAVINGVTSATETPVVGWLLAGAAVASVIAAMASIPKFATGGIVPGTSFTGDKVPALLNSGEMILNGSQQSNLFQMLNSGLYGSLSQKIAPSAENGNQPANVTFRIHGRDLEGVLSNHYNQKSKVR
ncbi:MULTISPECIES: hypothetical protein [Bacteroides]|jgi:hypothetical protein|uniref:hypothetical protein n=1 Tax=Bacteroides TaxID=816 RepID=UPI0001BC842F|nr:MULTISPECIES: hypothetical protein [Bacteroides]DAN63926.1 MAG TPA: putative tail length tape measure protein [Bacteriophage sp.]EFS29743.1 hypothetical protein BSGG_0443 [Bacteroides sp. D2]MBG9216745.1 hypothetical protein [Bacteroides ovatus]MBG9229873.1 hypothetical protein [Bacteroides ovatus]RHK35999.1 hypothetical protein DW071_04530 [Bacteroides ovatus]